MKFAADLHIHSHFSIATSPKLVPEFLDVWARIKGLRIVGTGDCIHPGWLDELEQKLEPAESGLYRLKPSSRIENPDEILVSSNEPVSFLLSAEISCIYKKNGKVRKVHNVVCLPDFKSARKLQRKLSEIGNIESDGRPILGLDSKLLLEMALECCPGVLFIPAHIWTPWFSALGDKSGFENIEECYDDLSEYIYTVETGLSSDPPMNRICSFLDRYTLVSNSDAHSPEKLGREANLFDTDVSFPALTDALRDPHACGYLGTIEFFPQEGKYHFDGHRKCGIRWNPFESIAHDGVCPECGKNVTVGVLSRVARLADRNELPSGPVSPFSGDGRDAGDRTADVRTAGEGWTAAAGRAAGGRRAAGGGAPGDGSTADDSGAARDERPAGEFFSLIPLKEILSELLASGPGSKKVDREYRRLVAGAGSELNLLLWLPLDEVENAGDGLLREAIRRMRRREVFIEEGYDGEYGKVRVFERTPPIHHGAGSNLLPGFDVKQKETEGVPPPAPFISFDVASYQTQKKLKDGNKVSAGDIAAISFADDDTMTGQPGDDELQREAVFDGGQMTLFEVARDAGPFTANGTADAAGIAFATDAAGRPDAAGIGYASRDAGSESAAGTAGATGTGKANDPAGTAGAAANVSRRSMLDALNPEQRAAAVYAKGPLLIVAGPGTGKTRTLAYRIAHLVETFGVAPEQILALTFTNKAANEMAERISDIGIKQGGGQWVTTSTFHSFGYAIIADNYERFGRNRNFSILSDRERLKLVGELDVSANIFAALEIAAGPGAQCAAYVSLLKQRIRVEQTRSAAGDRGENHDNIKASAESELLEQYESSLRRYNAFDLDDLILLPYRLLTMDAILLEAYRERYRWIIVDEYQDINHAQYSLLRLLAPKPEANLCAIGDPDQAIYGFRGADSRYIRSFLEDFPDAAVYNLKTSYRCSNPILKASGQMLGGPRSVQPGEGGLVSGLVGNVKLKIAELPTDKSEAEYVARTIENMIGGLRFFSMDSDISEGEGTDTLSSLSEIAVLCRTGRQMGPFEKAFSDHSVPFQRVGGKSIFQQEPGVSLLDVIRVAINPDNLPLRNLLQETKRYPKSNVKSAIAYAQSAIEGGAVSVSDLILQLAGELGVEAGREGRRVVEKLAADAEPYGTDLKEYLKAFDLHVAGDGYKSGIEQVALMTLHASKGLEFEVVFVVGLEDGVIPYSLDARDPPAEDEERRLLYVGMTRAKRYLYLTRAKKRTVYGKTQSLPKSPFLDAIEREMFETVVSDEKTRRRASQLELFS